MNSNGYPGNMGPIGGSSSRRDRSMNGDEGPSRRSDDPSSGAGQRLGGYSTYTTYDSSRPEGQQRQSYYEPYGDYARSQSEHDNNGDDDGRRGGMFSSRGDGTQRPCGSLFAAGVAELRSRRGRGQNPFSTRGRDGPSEYMVEQYQPRHTSSRSQHYDPHMGIAGVRAPTQQPARGMSMEDDGYVEESSRGYGREQPRAYGREQVYGGPRGFGQEQGVGREPSGEGRPSDGRRRRPQRYFNFAHLRP